ncbi:MAG: ion transporter [Flavobacterium sp.]|nr:MAG: ion transporter [Flavobacterium sp.]
MMQDQLKKYNLKFTLQSGMLIWHMLYLLICIGSNFHPIIAALQLFDVIIRSDTVGRIVMAISRNLNQFLWTLILLVVTVDVYSLVGLYFLNDRFQDGDVGPLCHDAYSCFLASLNLGLRSGGGIADALQKLKYDEDNKVAYLVNTLFDLSFYIIIVTLLLNLIFGMIIDAFGDLRDEKSSNEEDMENVCFICGLQRSEYERTDNYEKHISKEHNMWKYLAYLVYLQEKSKLYITDFTDLEDYVLDRYKNQDYMWIPVGRSLTLERHLAKGEKEKKSEIEKMKANMDYKFEKLMEQTKYLISRIDEESHGAGGHKMMFKSKQSGLSVSKQNSNIGGSVVNNKPLQRFIKSVGTGKN